jgi:hypothetical protein
VEATRLPGVLEHVCKSWSAREAKVLKSFAGTQIFNALCEEVLNEHIAREKVLHEHAATTAEHPCPANFCLCFLPPFALPGSH